MDRVLTHPATNILGHRIRCRGDEKSLMECSSGYESITGQTLTRCSGRQASAILCDQGWIQMGDNPKASTRGLPYLRPNKDTTESYICADGFDDNDAQVFCRMRSWKFGKAVTIPEAVSRPTNYPIRLGNVSCSSTDPHLLDCSHTFAGESRLIGCSGAAAVECSPGFPLTLRIENLLEDKIPPDELTIGYAVIDTVDKPGYICGGKVNMPSATVICKTVGFSYGLKLPNGIYHKPQHQDPLYVMDRITCGGEERSVFECQLGPWGDHRHCGGGEKVLSVACSDDLGKLVFRPRLEVVGQLAAAASTTSDGARTSSSSTISSDVAIPSLETGMGLIEICSAGDGTATSALLWTDLESDVICRQMGYECGMLNRTGGGGNSTNEALSYSDSKLSGVFAEVVCSGSEGDLLECQIRLKSSPCGGSGSIPVLQCLPQGHVDIGLCKLLRQARRRDGGEGEEVEKSQTQVELQIALAEGATNGGNSSCVVGSSSSRAKDEDTKIFIGSGNEANLLALRQREEMEVKVSAKMIDSHPFVTSSSSSGSWGLEERGCQMEEDYSMVACRQRCRAEFAIGACGCLPWHLSRTEVEREGGGDEICKGHGLECVTRIASALDMAPDNVTLAESFVRRKDLNLDSAEEVRKSCTKCMMPCNGAVIYSLEAASSQAQCLERNGGGGGGGILRIVVDRESSTLYLRRVVLIWEVLLGIIGGIMAILAGFSLICILELIYFCTVRLCYNINDPEFKKKSEGSGYEGEKVGFNRAVSEPDIAYIHDDVGGGAANNGPASLTSVGKTTTTTSASQPSKKKARTANSRRGRTAASKPPSTTPSRTTTTTTERGIRNRSAVGTPAARNSSSTRFKSQPSSVAFK